MMGFPETPRWLIKNGKINEACHVLEYLREASEDECEDECKEIRSTLGECYVFSLKLHCVGLYFTFLLGYVFVMSKQVKHSSSSQK